MEKKVARIFTLNNPIREPGRWVSADAIMISRQKPRQYWTLGDSRVRLDGMQVGYVSQKTRQEIKALLESSRAA